MSSGKKIKILYVLDSLEIGGANLLTVETINLLVTSDKISIHVLTLLSKKNDKKLLDKLSSEVELVSMNFDEISFFQRISLLKKAIVGFDFVHSALENANFYCSLVKFLTGSKIFFLTTAHGLDSVFIEDENLQRMIKKNWSRRYIFYIKQLQTFLFRYYDHFIAVSEFTKNQLVKYRKIAPSKITTIYHGINVRKYSSLGFNKKKSEKFLLCYLGRITHGKGLEGLIKNFPNLENQETVELILAGDGPIKRELEELRDSLGFTDKIKFVGEVTDVGEFFSNKTIFILPSNSEGLPLTLLEAMYFETLPVCTDVGGISEVIEDKNTGFLFPKGDYKRLYEILNFLIQDKSVNRDAREGKTVIEQKFDINNNYKHILNFYLNSAKSF